MRDLKKVANKLLQVLHPKGDRNVLRDCKYIRAVVRVRCLRECSDFLFQGIYGVFFYYA